MNANFSPIYSDHPAYPATDRRAPPALPFAAPAPSMALLYAAQDEVGIYAEREHCYRTRQLELENEMAAEAGEDVRELLAQRPAPTPNGALVGVISDLVAALQGMLSHGDAGDRTRAVLALKKAGVR